MATGDIDFDTYKGKYVFDKFPYWIESPEETFIHGIDTFVPLGMSFAEVIETYPRFKTHFRHICNTKALVSSINDFFDCHLGRLSALWFPSFKKDFVLTADIGATDVTINVEDTEYDSFYPELPGTGRYIFIYINANKWFARKITGAPTSTSLTLEVSLGEAVTMAKVKMISILYFGRFDIDEIEWTYISPDVAYADLYFIELPNEYADLP